MKYSNIDGYVTWSGGGMLMKRGLSFSDDHPLVAERADLFTDEEPGATVSNPTRVQTGMQGPGAFRSETAPRPIAKAAPRRA
jgi:hypothetical protein